MLEDRKNGIEEVWNNKINKKKRKEKSKKRKRGRKLEKELKRHSGSNHQADWLAGARSARSWTDKLAI